MITERTKQALKDLGYELHFEKGHEKRLSPFDAPWSVTVPYEDGADMHLLRDPTEDGAWESLLEAAENHSEELMNKLVSAILKGTDRQVRFMPDGGAVMIDGALLQTHILDGEPHEAAFKLWLHVCTDVEK